MRPDYLWRTRLRTYWPAPQPGQEMTFLEHLEELRWTLVRSAIAIAVGMLAAFMAKDFVFDHIILAPKARRPSSPTASSAPWGIGIGMGDALCSGDLALTLQNISMSGQFFTHLMVSFVAGFIIAFPYVLWEIWRFIAPGLHGSERTFFAGHGGLCVGPVPRWVSPSATSCWPR